MFVSVVVLCGFLCFLDVVRSEELFCEEKHKFADEVLDGFIYGRNYCFYETFGQHFFREDCSLVEFDVKSKGFKQCSDLHFKTTSSAEITKLIVLPSPYNFNMRYRLQHRADKDDNYCMEMYLHNDTRVNDETSLSFTCRKFDATVEGMDAELYFSVGESPQELLAGGHFLMRIPRFDNIQPDEVDVTRWQLLVILDVSHLPVVRIFWPVAPANFHVSGYILKVNISDSDLGDWSDFKLYQINSSACDDDVCLKTISLGYGKHRIKATVQMVDEKCKPNLCISESPSAVIVAGMPVHLWLAIILFPIAALIVLICSLSYYCHRRWKNHPTVLILYKPSGREHCLGVILLIEYLEAVYGVQCLLYKECEEECDDAPVNPSAWWREAFARTDVVLVIASPPCHSYFQYFRNSVITDCGFSELRSQLKVQRPSKRFLVAVPPYCKAEDTPVEGRELLHLHLPADFGLLSLFMFCPNSVARIMESVSMVRWISSYCCCSNQVSSHEKLWANLREAWEDAGAARRLMGAAFYPTESNPVVESVDGFPRISTILPHQSTDSRELECGRTADEDTGSFILNQFEL